MAFFVTGKVSNPAKVARIGDSGNRDTQKVVKKVAEKSRDKPLQFPSESKSGKDEWSNF
ncbi:hypothetical protein HVMH_1469 [Hydrogenovibrio marinus]|nr:hypothetical protein HVMH_1469 [Hydrogenovibrio marinus]